jgi:hypothetical protein
MCIHKTQGIRKMKKQNNPKHVAAHQTKVTDLATSVYQTRLGTLQDTAQTLEPFNADVVEARYFYEMYWLHPERGF